MDKSPTECVEIVINKAFESEDWLRRAVRSTPAQYGAELDSLELALDLLSKFHYRLELLQSAQAARKHRSDEMERR